MEYDIVQKESNNNDFEIENNLVIGQEEEDFELAFNQIFKKKNLVVNEVQEEYHEIEKKIYYLKNNNNYLTKEEPNQIAKKVNVLKSEKKVIENMEIEEEKSLIKQIDEAIFNKENENKNNNIELRENNENIGGDIEVDENLIIIEVKKNETNNSITNDIDKQNKFRVYSLNDFHLFHPGGTSEYYKQLREELNDEINKQLKEDNKSYFNISKFKAKKESNKITKRQAKEKKKRKEKPDDIRKKIKSRFFKTIKNRINLMLKSAKSKVFFDFLPQCFICNISKEKNKCIINMKLKEIMSEKFFEDKNKNNDNNKIIHQKKRNPDKKKYDNNIRTLKYLEKNNEICKKSNFNVIGNMTFKQIFNEYLKSEEFEREIEKLREEQNSEKYIKDYIIKAYNFISYFSK